MSSYRLYLDLQLAQMAEYTERGSIQYTLEHARALTLWPGLVAGIGLNPAMPMPKLVPELFNFPGLQWSTLTNFKSSSKGRPVAYHVMSPFAPASGDWVLPSFSISPENELVVTLVDLTPLTSPDPMFQVPEVARRYSSRFQLIRQAGLVLSISENTTREAIDLLGLAPGQIRTIGAGVSSFFRPPAGGESPATVVNNEIERITRPFILSVTGIWEWKNTDRLIEAFSRLPVNLRAEMQLVVVCRLNEAYKRKWADLVADKGMSGDDVIFTDLISRRALRALYQTAGLFVYPSLYEGFGLPAAEAAACGCPTIVSNTSSMPEILGWDEATFDPYQPDDIARLIEKSLSDSAFNDELKQVARSAASRNTWPSVAKKTVEALNLLPEPKVARRRALGFAESTEPGAEGKPRLAMIAGFASGPSAGEDDRVELARRISAESDLHLFSTNGLEELRDLTGCPCFSAGAFGTKMNPAGYESVIFPFTSDRDIAEVAPIFREFPGVACFLNGEEEFAHLTFGQDPAPSVEIVALALGLVVPSERFARLLKLDQGPFGRIPPFRVGPSRPDRIPAQRPETTASGLRAVARISDMSRFAQEILRSVGTLSGQPVH